MNTLGSSLDHLISTDRHNFTKYLVTEQSPLFHNNKMQVLILTLTLVVALLSKVYCGPVAVGLCYTACNAGYGTCLAAVGVTAGVTAPVTWAGWFYGVPAACVACSAAQGACMTLCTPLLVAPTL